MHNAQNIWYGNLGIVLRNKTNYKNKILYNTGDKNNKNWKQVLCTFHCMKNNPNEQL